MTVFRENRILLCAFREGRPEALREVYLFYIDQIIAILNSGFTDRNTSNYIRGVRDPERRRELLQEIFIRAFSKSARTAYDGIRPYKSFLATIAGNLMIDALRADARDPLSDRRRETEEVLSRSASTDEGNTDVEGDDAEAALHWRRCLRESDLYVATLDELSKEFVRYRFQEELSERDAAQKLNLSRSKVRTLERRIRGGLRRHLRQRGLLDT